MDEQLTDEQQAEKVFRWVRENGWYLVGGLVLGLGALFGWRQWEARNLAQSEAASALYAELLTAIRVDRSTRAEEIAAELARDFGSSPYTDQARLALAHLQLERGKLEEAVTQLREAMAQANSAGIAHIARLRLARVLLHQEKAEEALQLLQVPERSVFAARYHDVRGDALYALGRLDEARKEYEAALQGAGDGVIDQAFVQAKHDELAGDAAPAVAGAPAGAP